MSTRQARVLAYFLPTLLGRWGEAQEEFSGNPPAVPSPSRRYFDRPIDFWKAGLSFEKENEPTPPAARSASVAGPGNVRIRESVWAQPIQTPDGNWVVYVPPPAVLNFLENPTSLTAKAYVAWKADQADKLKKAFSLLQEAKAKPEGKKESADSQAPEVTRPEPSPTGAVTLVYFHQKTCPHCTTQDGVLEKWLKRHPQVHLSPYEPGERDDLWKAFQVRGTPTLVLRARTGDSPVVLVGLQTEEKLESALGALRTDRKESSGVANPARKE